MFGYRYDRFSAFASNLATCLAAGVDLSRGIRTSSGALSRSMPEFRMVWDRVDHGQPLSEALQVIEHRLPPFALPVIVCGEQTGRLEESLRFLAEHCRALHRPTEALRNTWLVPLTIYLAGQALGCLLHLVLGSWSGLLSAIVELLITIGSLAAIAVLLRLSPFKALGDRVKLLVPVLGAAERELAVSRFLHVFSLLYSSGGSRVETMIRNACRPVTNIWLRQDLLRAATRIENGVSLPEAFASTSTLSLDEQHELAAGELAGRLAETSSRMAMRADESAAAKLNLITRYASRIMSGLVTFSLAGTFLRLLILGQFLR